MGIRGTTMEFVIWVETLIAGRTLDRQDVAKIDSIVHDKT
jgi:hypothetical protein